ALSQLAGLRVEGQVEVGEEGEGDLADDGDTVLGVGGHAGVAADRDHAVDGQRNLDVAERGVRRVAGNGVAVRVGEVEHQPRGDEGVGTGGTDVEAADVLVAAAVDAVSGRSDFAAEAGDVRELHTVAEDVV